VTAVRKPVLACAILLIISPVPAGSAADAAGRTPTAQVGPAPVYSVVVPGGVAALAAAAGLDPSIPRARLMLAVIRVVHEWLPGVDAQTDARRKRVLQHISNPGPSSPAVPAGDGVVPLPLPAESWAYVRGVGAGAPESLLHRILATREASLAYFGLSAMDDQTREYLGASPTALAAVTDAVHAPLLALYGRSLHVHDGVVDVPGGREAVPLWEDAAGVPVTQPAEFLRRVLDKDGGRLALLYDVVAHLEPRARDFVLGLGAAESSQPAERSGDSRRLERFRALYRACAAALVSWDPRARPFERAGFDAAHVLSLMIMRQDGRPAGPSWRPYWEAVFAPDTPGGQPVRVTGPVSAWEPVDAAWIIEHVCVTSITLRRQRAETFAFAQRVFPEPAPDSLPDIFVALRGFPRFNMLLLTLERMGITDPATHAAAVRTAERISSPDGYRAWSAVTQFQSIIAIIERTRFARAIDAAAANRLVRSVCAVPVTKDGDYGGGLAAWLERWLLSGGAPGDSAAADRADRPAETALLGVMAGAVSTSPFADTARMPTVEWEGQRYRVDPAAETLRRLIAVRERQGGPSLDAVLALIRRSGALLSTAEPDKVWQRSAALVDTAAALQMPQPPKGVGRRADEPDVKGTVAKLRPLVFDRTLKATRLDFERVVGEIHRDADWYLAAVLSAIVYAQHVGPADSPALLGGDPSLRHELGIGDARFDIRADGPWRPPVESRDREAGWRVTGSLLGLDLALGRLALRRVASEEMPPAPRLSDIERRAVVEPVVLLSPFDQADSDMTRLADALARGRRRIAEAGPSGITLERLAEEAGLDEWRLQMLPWMREHEPEYILGLWSLSEIAGLGVVDGSGLNGFDAFGGSQWSLRGQLACRFPWRQTWTTLSGRKGSGIVPAMAADLVIAVAESLAAEKLPARLTVGVLSVAAQDLLDRVRVSHADDWAGLTADAQRVVRGRLEDYVAALTSNGPLVPMVQEPRYAGRQ
jgi:hypothetical protein